MRLADFIESNTEPILADWVTFARAISPSTRGMDLNALRDHLLQMLCAIVLDLRTSQTDAEQAKKSRGDSDATHGTADTAAQVHGAGRAISGFTVSQMVSEYRALRASVIRLWTDDRGMLRADDFEDLLRFNEAIDQSLAESIQRYTDDMDRSKEMFLAILGHDLRSPLSAILMASQFMLEEGTLPESLVSLTMRVERSGQRMNHMIEDLLDFTRTRLGSGIPLKLDLVDLATTLADAVAETREGHPAITVDVKRTGDLQGRFDAARISQLLGNLLGNAVHHGEQEVPITVMASGRDDDVVICVQNSGRPIPADRVPGLFSPFKRLAPGESTHETSNHLGLGLYIAEQIVTAHGGTIDVSSSVESGTSFTVRLPRQMVGS